MEKSVFMEVHKRREERVCIFIINSLERVCTTQHLVNKKGNWNKRCDLFPDLKYFKKNSIYI
jgi:hypothetical protein